MKARNENLTSIDAIMDAEFGKPGTPEREEFRKEAYAYCMGQIICDARKKEKMTQSELAEKIWKGNCCPVTEKKMLMWSGTGIQEKSVTPDL